MNELELFSNALQLDDPAERAALTGQSLRSGCGATRAWPLDAQGAHPLTELLLGDYLILDVSKP
jgi:hypothetical protein